MKKNISINISGIIFHIEENGYERLKEYLDSINKYFSTFDDSSEIIADIESRIAEIFLEKLKDDKQVITNEDVIALAATMGSIQDFQAAEEDTDNDYADNDPTDNKTAQEEFASKHTHTPPSKRLYRDTKRKLVGGVASGIANYFSIDPVWIRLGFIVLLFDVFITFSVSPIAFIAYIILWIAVPGSDVLEEDKSLKKLYRNPEGKVIAGVSQGLAKFLDIDITVVRVLFVLSIFLGGTGLLVYAVLWIILPEATSITDRVQMEGEKITLENIDSSIKKAQVKEANSTEESKLATVLLFPFRILGTIFKGMTHAFSPILNFLGQLARIFAGIIITIIGISLFFSITLSIVVLLGLLTGASFLHLGFIPVDLVSESFPTIGIIGTFLVTAIPSLLLLLVGISLLLKKQVIQPTFGWALFGVWIIGTVMMLISIPNVLFQYKEQARISETTAFNSEFKGMYFDIANVGFKDYKGLKIKMKGYDGADIKLIKEFSAHGPSKKEAAVNAKMITYNVVQNDSILAFDSNVEFAKNAVYRNQELRLTLMIPYHLKFTMDEDFNNLLRYGISSYGFYSSDIKDNTFYFNESGLDCATCLTSESNMDRRRNNYEEVFEESSSTYGNSKSYKIEDFEAVRIVGPFSVSIAQGDEYRVVISGQDHKINEIKVAETNGVLTVAYDEDNIELYKRYRKLKLRIIMPKLTNVTIKGASVGDIAGFEAEKMNIRLAAASEITIDSDINFMIVNLTSASRLNLIGNGKVLEAKLSSAAQLDAYKFNVQNVSVKVSSAASAKVYATETLSIKASSLGDVKYRGGATVTKSKASSLGHISED
ncbi:MAG: PspC domain-containing protein [Cyclobacteriaceae bacterium]|nr:PspC domain-containing protein [Cyclobacteriaceae bacterium]